MRNKERKASLGQLLMVLIALFVLMNVVAFFHAYKFTHFSSDVVKTKSPEKLSFPARLKTLVFGINNPRPGCSRKPARPYRAVTLQSNRKIACWYIAADSNATAKGTIILFHGYSGDKASMLDKADEFLKMGYNTVLVDFMGSGASEGTQTTIGYKEAVEVRTAFDYVASCGEENIYLFGTSMGAVAILKAVGDYRLSPKAVILECPFGSMYQTVCARFSLMHVPSFPMAALLVFWGGVQNGFWAFGHNPVVYARNVNCSTLLVYGEQDKNVSRQEIDDIYQNLAGAKKMKLLHLAGHDDFLLKNHDEWVESVSVFLSNN